MQTITRDLIRRGQSLQGGWNREQVELLGIQWPPRHGWQRRLLGRPISDQDAARFLALRGQTLRAKKSKRISELPLPPQIKPSIAATLEHTWSYLKRMDPTDLKNALPSLQYIARACAMRVEGIEATPAHECLMDELDGG